MAVDEIAGREEQDRCGNPGERAVEDEGPGQAQRGQASGCQGAERRAELDAKREPPEGGAASLARATPEVEDEALDRGRDATGLGQHIP